MRRQRRIAVPNVPKLPFWLRLATGESWHLLMFDCVNDRIGCRNNQSYEDLRDNGPMACGDPAAAYLYFISYQLVVTWVVFNLFVGAIVDAFVDQKGEDRLEEIRDQQVALYHAVDEVALCHKMREH